MSRISLIIYCFAALCLGIACNSQSTTATASAPAEIPTASQMANMEPEEEMTRNHKIEFEVKNFAGDYALIAFNQGASKLMHDTIPAQNGKFVLEGEDPLQPGIYIVALPPSNTYFEFMLDRDQVFSVKTDTTDFVGTMQFEGSEQNEIFYEDIRFLSAQSASMQSVQQQLQAATQGTPEYDKLVEERKNINDAVLAFRAKLVQDHPTMLYGKVVNMMTDPVVPEAPQNADGSPVDSLFGWKYTRARWLDQIDFNEKGLVRTPTLEPKITQYLERFTYQHPDSVIVSIDEILGRAGQGNYEVFRYCLTTIFNKYVNIELMCWDKIFVHMAETYYLNEHPMIDWPDSTMLADMRERAVAMKPTICGEIAPDFTVNDGNGKPVSMHSIEAPYTIVYFWDYDCGHCKTETPKLVDAYKKHQKDGVALMTLSINGDVDEWKDKLAKDYQFSGGIHTQDHRRQSGFDRYYDLRTTPRMFVLDKDKRIIAKRITAEQLDQIFAFEKQRKSAQ
ncbi:MAG: TlpA disulfide reductase family protein [Bacteroidota bacterium]